MIKTTKLCLNDFDELTISPFGDSFFIGLSDISDDDEIDSSIVVSMDDLKDIYKTLGQFIKENDKE
jgi:hypothetical protein